MAMRAGHLLVLFAVLVAWSAHAADEHVLNRYVLSAVDQLAANKLGKGYGPSAFTEDLLLGRAIKLTATSPPQTMCVAAQMEILVMALNGYMQDTGDRTPELYLRQDSWKRLYPKTLRGMLWRVQDSGSSGGADALASYGMGRLEKFENLLPGSFVNMNRDNGTGHAVIFMNYIDGDGRALASYSEQVKGFRYFSSQGKKDAGGLGFRFAFFSRYACPVLDPSRKRDCGVIFSMSQRLLNSGSLLHPKHWDKTKRDLMNSLVDRLPKGEGVFDSEYFSGETTDD